MNIRQKAKGKRQKKEIASSQDPCNDKDLGKARTIEKYQPAKIEQTWPSSAKATGGQAGTSEKIAKYIPSHIESKWQKYWEDNNTYPSDPTQPDTFYVLAEFAYPSGDLHLGHWFTFSGADIFARFKRMQGKNVFFPNGFDAFGLPAENAAIKRNIHPQDWTLENVKRMKAQYATMGGSFSFKNQVITCLPEYYRWNQWIFIKMLEKGIAYRAATLSNWCPVDQTVLANEHVENGRCWRCGAEVVQKEVEQWFLRITEYADRLLWKERDPNRSELHPNNPKKIHSEHSNSLGDSDHPVDWPDSVRRGQNDWIGKSEGAEIEFPLVIASDSEAISDNQRIASSQAPRNDNAIKVYTVYPETIYGVTYMVLAPEHTLVKAIIDQNVQVDKKHQEEVRSYVEDARKKTELERKELDRQKTGVFTGLYCTNPVNGRQVPIWVADYVIGSYGTGAVMGVPGSDHRDFAFAKKYNLPVIRVIAKDENDTSDIKREDDVLEEGYLVNSGDFSGLKTPAVARGKIIDYLVSSGFGTKASQYHLHDWSVSRQRYWGTPVPMIHCEHCAEKGESWFTTEEGRKACGVYHLSLETRNLKLDRESVVSKLEENQTSRFQHQDPASRLEHLASTMKGIYPVPEKDLPVELPYDVDYAPRGKAPLASNEKWMSVNCPKCGRFAKRDPETLDTFFDSSWYFFRYLSPHDETAPYDQAVARNAMPVDIYFGGAEHTLGHTLYSRFFTKFFKDIGITNLDEYAARRVNHGVILGPDGNRMSKSRGNVVNPDLEVKRFGADTIRVYLAFFMPYEATGPWISDRVWGAHRFLQRVWALYNKVQRAKLKVKSDLSRQDLYILHKTIKKVGDDIESIKYNTAIAALMEWLNHLSRKQYVSANEYKTFLLLLAPFAPHMTEELSTRLERMKSVDASGKTYKSIHLHSWPDFAKEFLVEETVTIVVQINGKHRAEISLSKDIIPDQKKVEQIAQTASSKYLEEKTIHKVIYIPGKIINFVV